MNVMNSDVCFIIPVGVLSGEWLYALLILYLVRLELSVPKKRYRTTLSQNPAGADEAVAPVLLVEVVHDYALRGGGMHEASVTHHNADVQGVTSGPEENEVANHQLTRVHGHAGVHLLPGCSRDIDIEPIAINVLYEGRAVDPAGCDATKPVGHAAPLFKLLKQALLNLILRPARLR